MHQTIPGQPEFVPQWRSRESRLFVVLAAVMISSAIIAELVAVKLFQLPFYRWLGISFPFTLTCGSLVWPLVFLTTDTINEFFGRRAVRFISWLTVVMIVFIFAVTNLSIRIDAAPFSSVQDREFYVVYGQSIWIMFGSVAAFLISQLVDVTVFQFIRRKLHGRHIWARATGSTIVSQLIDSFVVIYIAFGVPKKNTWAECLNISLSSFAYKVGFAIVLTPLIYLAHFLVFRWLGRETAARLQAAASER